jgi:hypothetical protein
MANPAGASLVFVKTVGSLNMIEMNVETATATVCQRLKDVGTITSVAFGKGRSTKMEIIIYVILWGIIIYLLTTAR